MSIISKIMELSEEIVKKTDSNTTQKTVKNVIGFYGIKAGLGTSTIVANTAIVLASNGYKVCVIDMDVHFPVQIRLLGSKSNKKIHSFIDAFLNTSINLAEVFNDSILPNLKLLSTSPTNTPTKFFDMPEIQVRKMIEESSLLFDLVLIDFGGADVGYETTTRGLPCCNQVYTVITPNADILEGTFKMFSFFREFKYTNADISVIQNMVIEDPIKGSKLKEFDMTHLMDLPYYSDIARLRYNDKLIIKSNIEGKSADVWRAGVLTLASLIADSSSADSYTTAATEAKGTQKKASDANSQIKLNEDQLNKMVDEPEDEDDEVEFSVDRRNGPSPLEMAVQTSNQRTAEVAAAKEKAALEARQQARAEVEEAERAEAEKAMNDVEAKARAAREALEAAKARAEKLKAENEAKAVAAAKTERERAETEARAKREREQAEAVAREKTQLEAEAKLKAENEAKAKAAAKTKAEADARAAEIKQKAEEAERVRAAEEKSHVAKQSAEQALAQEKLQQAIARQRVEEIEAKKVAAELAAKRIAEQEAKEKEVQAAAKAEAEQAAKVEAERKARIEAEQRAAEEEAKAEAERVAKAEAERVARAAEAEEARIIAELERQAAALEREAEAVRQQEALRLTKLKQQQAEEDARREQQRRDAELLAQREEEQQTKTTKSISAISLNELTAHRTPSSKAQTTGTQAQQRYAPPAEPVVERANVARPAARPINYKTPVSVKQEVEPQRTVLLQKPMHAQGNRPMQMPETKALRKPSSTQDSIIPGVARAARPVAVSMLDNSMQVLKRFNLSGSKPDESPNPGEEPKEPMSVEPPKAEDLFSRYLGGGTTESKSPPPEISEYTPIATGAQSKQNDVVSAEKLAGIAKMFDGVGDSDEEIQQNTAEDAGDSEDAAARFAKMMHSMRDPEIIGAEELGGND